MCFEPLHPIQGKWKMAHYYAKDFFSTVLVSPVMANASHIEVYLICDSSKSLLDLRLEVAVQRFDDDFSKEPHMRFFDVVDGCLGSTERPLPSSRVILTLGLVEILTVADCRDENGDLALEACFMTFR